MKRSNWVRLIAVILIISMLAAPVSAATNRGSDGVRTNGLIGFIVEIIRDIIRDIFDDWFDKPGDGEPVPTEPIETTAPTAPGETEPTEPGETEPGETKPTTPGETKPTEPGETEPDEPELNEPPQSPDNDLELIEGHANTANGHLLRGVTYSLASIIAQQGEPLTTATANRFGTKLGNSLGGNAISTSLKTMASKGGIQTMAATETTISETPLVITTDDLGPVIPDGNYLIRYNHATYGSYMTNNTKSGSPWGTTVLLGTTDKSAATPFTFTRQADGSYAIQGPAGNYMNIDANNTGNIIYEANYFTVEIQNDGIWLRDTSSSKCINALGANYYSEKYFGGYSDGSPLELYAATTTVIPPKEPEQPAIGSELVFFPVTMFNYDHNVLDAATDAMDADLTVRDGLYFTGAGINYTAPTYFTSGRYYIQNIRASANRDDGAVWLQAHADNKIYAVTQENATIWNLVVEGDLYYLTCDINGVTNYMKVGTGANDDGYTTDKTPINLVAYSGNNQGVQIKQNGYYLCQWGGVAVQDFGGYNVNNDAGNGMRFYAVDAEDNVSDTPTTIQSAVSDIQIAGTKPHNSWAYFSDGDSAQNMFYSGLVEENLVDGEIQFTVNEPGIFTFDKNDPTKTSDGLKDIYQYVGLPFIKNEKGYYTFNSDAHGTYFADTTGDGVSDPWYGAADDFFNMYFDYENTQTYSGIEGENGDGSSKLWMPYNINDDTITSSSIDYHFGMRADIPFSMTPNGRIDSYDTTSEPITFTFAGDDDVWIFIDGQLVIDLGGIHNRIGATIDFANNTITYFRPESNTNTLPIGSFNDPENYVLNEDGTITVKLYDDASGAGALGQTRADFSTKVDHQMSIFYLERGKGTANCQIEFNLPMLDTVLVTKDITHSWSAREDELDGPDKDGTAPLTAKEQAAVDKMDFDFKLWKMENGGRYTAVANTNYYLLDKDDNILGIYPTGADGTFSLKNGQTAMFMTDLGNGTVTYAVEELDLDLDTFLTPDYKFAGLATDGFDFYGETLNNDTEDENDTKTVQEHLTDASLIGEQELPMNAERLVSYDVTPYGSIEAIESLEFICTNYLNADLPNPTARAYEDIIVIDYGLPVQVDPLHNDLFRGENIEIVAWGDETLKLNEVLESNQIYAVPDDTEGGTSWNGNKVLAAAKVAASNNSYNDALIDLADCLYTFKAVGDDCYEVSATTADGTKVYLNHYTTDTNEIPNDSIPGRIKIADGANDNMFKLIAQVMDGGTGSARTLHFHTEQTVPYWNRCDNDNNHTCQEYLYRPAGKDDVSSTEIPGYVMVTSLDDIVDGGQYLIVHDKDASSTDDDMFVLHPSTSGDKYDHVAKLETTDVPAIGSAFSFDFGTVKFNDVTYAEHAHDIMNADGTTTTTYTYTRDTFEYELTEQLTEVEEIRYIIKVNSTVEEEIGDETVTKTACRYALGKVYIVPATIMYYEENFNGLVKFTNKDGVFTPVQMKAASYVSPYQEPGVVGTVGDSTYGSDDAYECDPCDSNGTSYFFDTTNGYVRFQYTFTGTGTSFFARTSAKTGYMQVLLFNGALDDATQYVGDKEYQKDVWYRDTYYNDANNTDLDGESLYNIPVYTNNGLDYGTYTLLVTVAKAGTQGAGPNLESSRNEFYLDGIRIMRPLNESADETLTEKALDAYAADGESNLVVETLRQKLITDVKEGEAVWDGENFVVLTDTNDEITAAEDYISYGPKEEVYLAKGQKITFSMKYWEPQGLKLYIGMKAPFGTVGTDDVGPYSAKLNVGKNSFTLRNATDCYYDVTDMQEKLEAVYFQAEDANGNLLFTDAEGNKLYMDADGYFWNKETNEQFTVADGVVIYMDEEGNFWNSATGEKYEGEDRPTPVYTDEIDYYIITYTFEATESIVALTNIKVVGNFEFTIVEKNEETQEGGGSAEP